MSAPKEKWVMILEKSSDSLSLKKEDNKYVLEGIFAEFGVKNNNDRIYLEKEYLPHLDYLKEKINKKNLYGELDHPDKFDISLKNVSHVIEDLEFDKEKRIIKGKVRLLDTDAGRNAKALVDGGVQLSISSRAAGVVKENKEVQIKKIFTYDLVAEPGFPNAQLNRIDESLGIHNENIAIYEMGNDSLSEDVMRELYEEEKEIKKENIKNMAKTTDNSYVTVELLEAYTQHIKQQYDELKQSIKSSNNNEMKDVLRRIDSLSEEVTDLQKYSDYVAEQTDNVIKYAEYGVSQLDNASDDKDDLKESIKNIERYLTYAAENINSVIDENNNLKSYTNYLKENLETSIGFSENVAKDVNFLYNHNDHIAENVKNITKYLEYLKENLNANINYTEHVAEHTDNLIKYNEYVVENINNAYSGKNISESTTNNFRTDRLNLDEKIDSIIENVKKQKTESINEKSNFPYIKMLSESVQREFLQLEDSQKQKVIAAVNTNKPMNENDFVSIMNSITNPTDPSKVYERYVDLMPVEYKATWDSLTENKKNAILDRAKFYKMSTPYQVKYFWHGVNELKESVEFTSLNESTNISENKVLNSYGSEYLKNLALGLQRLKK